MRLWCAYYCFFLCLIVPKKGSLKDKQAMVTESYIQTKFSDIQDFSLWLQGYVASTKTQCYQVVKGGLENALSR